MFASGDGHELIMELKTDQEKLMEEKLIISSGADPSQWIEIIIHASVLGMYLRPKKKYLWFPDAT